MYVHTRLIWAALHIRHIIKVWYTTYSSSVWDLSFTPAPTYLLVSKFKFVSYQSASLKYFHLDEDIFCRVRRLAWYNDPEGYASGSVATGRATLARQVKGEHPAKERYTVLPGWGLSRWASTPSPRGKNTHMLKNLDKVLWRLGVGQRRTTFWNRHTYIHTYINTYKLSVSKWVFVLSFSDVSR